MTSSVLDRQATIPAARERQAATILARCVCLTLECHFLGNNRKIDTADLVEVSGGHLAMDEQQFHTTKKLIDTKELNPAMRVLGRAKDYLRTVAIATHRVFGERSYLVPVKLVVDVDARLKEFEIELRDEVQQLADRYEGAVERQRAALGPMFKAGDYVSRSRVVEAFSIDWNYVSFAAPDRLETIDRAIASAAAAKHERKLASAFDEVVLGLRSHALEVMQELAARLAPGDGKARAVRGTALRDLTDFADLLPKRNVGDDWKLAEVVARVKKLASGVDIETLRSEPAVRARIQAAAAAAAKELEGLVTTASARAISFGPLRADGA
mgnify:CR=1 FL=1